jgi:hypothetical protein
MHRVPEEPCGSQRRTAADAQIGFDGAEVLEPLRCPIEAAQRLRQVAQPESYQASVHRGFACFQFLAARIEKVLGSPEISDGTTR